MKRNVFIAAILALGITTSCNSKEEIIEQSADKPAPIVCNVKIPAFLGHDTKAVTPGQNGNLESSFTTNDDIYVYNLTGGYVAQDDQLQPTLLHPAANGKRADLVGNLQFCRRDWSDEMYTYIIFYNLPVVGDTLFLLYNCNNGIFEYGSQYGTLDWLNCKDYAIAEVRVEQSAYNGDGTYTLITSDANFENAQSFFKFTFTGLNPAVGIDVGIENITIHSEGNKLSKRLSVAGDEYNDIDIFLDTDAQRAANGHGVVYAALRFDSLESKEHTDAISFTVKGTDGEYYYATKQSPAGGFRNGRYYTSTIKLSNPYAPIFYTTTVKTGTQDIYETSFEPSHSNVLINYAQGSPIGNGTERMEWVDGQSLTLYSNKVSDAVKWADYAIAAGTISNSGDYSQARIVPEVENGLHWGLDSHLIYAVSPKSSVTNAGSNVKMSCSIPQSQTGAFDRNYAYMYAVSTDDRSNFELDFKPMCTVLEFTVGASADFAVKDVVISSATGNMSGAFDAVFTGAGDPSYTCATGSDAKKLNVNLSALDSKEVGPSKQITFTVIAPPNDLSGLSLEFTLDDGQDSKRRLLLKNTDGSNVTFAGGKKHRITGLVIPRYQWEDVVAINDDSGTYHQFQTKPYIDFTIDTQSGFADGEHVGQIVALPIASYYFNLPLLTDLDANSDHIETFKEALDDGNNIYFYLRYYVEPNQYYCWLHLELLAPNPLYREQQYLLKKETNFNPSTDRRIRYEEKIAINGQMVGRMILENGTTHHEGLFHISGGNVTIESLFISIE